MTRQEWWGASMVAVVATVLTMALSVLPMCWAAGKPSVAIPALPPAQLVIPSIKAQVSATAIPPPKQVAKVLDALLPDRLVEAGAIPTPWRGVKVQLTAKLPAGSQVAQVPVTVTVLRRTENPLSRVGPTGEQVAQVNASVPIRADGNGSTVVDMPLVWAEPEPAPAPAKNQTPNSALKMKTMISYQMVLSSTLGGQPTPTGLFIIRVPANAKGESPAPATQKR